MSKQLSRLWARGFSTGSHGNATEMEHFAQLASSWWDSDGPQRILHKMNLMRMDFIRETLKDYSNNAPGYSNGLLPSEYRQRYHKPEKLSILDIGCGGGLLSESLARSQLAKNIEVLGIDVTPEVIAVARRHQALDPALNSKLTYANTSVEDLDPGVEVDLLTLFEVLEHVDDPAGMLRASLSHVKRGGWAFISTINRTLLAYLSTIFMGEYVLQIVPKGTHTLSKYINEQEMREFIENTPGWQFARSQGCIFIPTKGWVRIDNNTPLLGCLIGNSGGNYLLAAHKPL